MANIDIFDNFENYLENKKFRAFLYTPSNQLVRELEMINPVLNLIKVGFNTLEFQLPAKTFDLKDLTLSINDSVDLTLDGYEVEVWVGDLDNSYSTYRFIIKSRPSSMAEEKPTFNYSAISSEWELQKLPIINWPGIEKIGYKQSSRLYTAQPQAGTPLNSNPVLTINHPNGDIKFVKEPKIDTISVSRINTKYGIEIPLFRTNSLNSLEMSDEEYQIYEFENNFFLRAYVPANVKLPINNSGQVVWNEPVDQYQFFIYYETDDEVVQADLDMELTDTTYYSTFEESPYFSKDGLTINEIVEDLFKNLQSQDSNMRHFLGWTYDQASTQITDIRSGLSFETTNLYEILRSLQENYQVYINYDTVDRVVKILPNDFGSNNGLRFEYGKYLKGINQDFNVDEQINYVQGKDANGIGFADVSWSGDNYLENYAYQLDGVEWNPTPSPTVTGLPSRWLSEELATELAKRKYYQDFYRNEVWGASSVSDSITKRRFDLQEQLITKQLELEELDAAIRQKDGLIDTYNQETDLQVKVNLDVTSRNTAYFRPIDTLENTTEVSLDNTTVQFTEVNQTVAITINKSFTQIPVRSFRIKGSPQNNWTNNLIEYPLNSLFRENIRIVFKLGNTIIKSGFFTITGVDTRGNLLNLFDKLIDLNEVVIVDNISIEVSARALKLLDNMPSIIFETIELYTYEETAGIRLWNTFIERQNYLKANLEVQKNQKIAEIGAINNAEKPGFNPQSAFDTNQTYSLIELEKRLDYIRTFTKIDYENLSEDVKTELKRIRRGQVYENSDIIDSKTLFEASEKFLLENINPSITIDIDSISILQAYEAQSDWQKVRIGEKVDIFVPDLKISIEAEIVEISIDFQNYRTALKIATTKNYDRRFGKYFANVYNLLQNTYKNIIVPTEKPNQQSFDFVNKNELIITQTIDGSDVAVGKTTGDGESNNTKNRPGAIIFADVYIDAATDQLVTVPPTVDIPGGGTFRIYGGNVPGNAKLSNGGLYITDQFDFLRVSLTGRDGLFAQKFRIDLDGNATFSGDLEAATGTFSGDLSAAGGTFTGDLSAAGGTFAGTLQAGVTLSDGETTLTDALSLINTTIGNLEDQIDGAITTWFYSGVPTLENEPASTWTTNEIKDVHLGDLYYDTVTGYAYRFALVTSTYQWIQITDTDVVAALANAAAAQETADSKMTYFTAENLAQLNNRKTLAKLGDVLIPSATITDTGVTPNVIYIEDTIYTYDGADFVPEEKKDGSVGGWTINATTIESNNGKIILDNDNSTITIGSDITGQVILDGAATGAEPVIAHENFELRANGDAIFSGNLSAAGGTFSGDLSAAGGTFSGDLSAAGGTFGSVSIDADGSLTIDKIIIDNSGIKASVMEGSPSVEVVKFNLDSSTGLLTATDANITGTITATSGSFTGSITSTSGTIGGFKITSDTIQQGDDTTKFVIKADSTNPYISIGQPINSYDSAGIFLGLESALPKLSLKSSTNNLLWDGSALSIKGSLTGSTGTFGGAADSLYKVLLGDNTTPLEIKNNTTTRMSVASDGTITLGALSIDNLGASSFTGSLAIGSGNTIFKADTNGIYLGNEIFASAPFSVSAEGDLKATSGTIGGVSIDSDRLYTGDGEFEDEATAFYLDTDGQFSLGTKFVWDGTDLIIDGEINANTGEIGGWKIGTDNLNSAGFKLKSSETVPYLSIGQVTEGFSQDGVFLGLVSDAEPSPTFIPKLSLVGSKSALEFDGDSLSITGGSLTVGENASDTGSIVIDGNGVRGFFGGILDENDDPIPTFKLSNSTGWLEAVNIFLQAENKTAEIGNLTGSVAGDFGFEITNNGGYYLNKTDISFTAATKTISSTITDLSVYKKGNKIIVTNSSSNNSIFTAANDGTATSLEVQEVLTDEPAGTLLTIARTQPYKVSMTDEGFFVLTVDGLTQNDTAMSVRYDSNRIFAKRMLIADVEDEEGASVVIGTISGNQALNTNDTYGIITKSGDNIVYMTGEGFKIVQDEDETFKVQTDGTVTAETLVIRGTSKLGGWLVGDDYFKSTNYPSTTYTGTTNPTSPQAGETWFDGTDYKVFTGGGSGQWVTTVFSTSGIQFNNDGTIIGKQFAIDSTGDAFFRGDLTAASGTFGATNAGHVILGNQDNPLQVKNNTDIILDLEDDGTLKFAGFTADASSLKAGTASGNFFGISTGAGTNDDISFWAGAISNTQNNIDAALFRVKTDGSLVATNANISGTINASDGSFTNTITVGEGTTAGKIEVGTDLQKIIIDGTNSAASTAIYSGTGNFGDPTMKFYLNAEGKFSLGDQLTWDPAANSGLGQLVILGDIEADTGSIGGWNVGTSTITSSDSSGVDAAKIQLQKNGKIVMAGDGFDGNGNMTNAKLTLDGTATSSNPMINSDNFKLNYDGSAVLGKLNIGSNGSIESSDNSFSISETGAATFAGTLSAPSGSIGGFTIGQSQLTAGTGTTSVGVSTGSTSFFAGNATPTEAPFRVTNEGALTSTSGSIGGWTIGTTTIKGGTDKITLDSNSTNPYIGIGTTAYDSNGIFLGYDSQIPKLSLKNSNAVFYDELTFEETFTNGFAINLAGSQGTWTTNAPVYTSAQDNFLSIISGPTVSANTGPSSAIQGSKYIYYESTGTSTIVRTIQYTFASTRTQPFKVEFFYHMWGTSTTSLTVYKNSINTGNIIFSKSGDQGNQWNEALIDVVGPVTSIIFAIPGDSGSFTSDIALDHIRIYSEVNHLKWDGSKLDIQGDIGGSIKSLTVGNITIDQTDGIVGKDINNNIKFSLNPNTGLLNASDGVFSGQINASSGNIGDWSIDSSLKFSNANFVSDLAPNNYFIFDKNSSSMLSLSKLSGRWAFGSTGDTVLNLEAFDTAPYPRRRYTYLNSNKLKSYGGLVIESFGLSQLAFHTSSTTMSFTTGSKTFTIAGDVTARFNVNDYILVIDNNNKEKRFSATVNSRTYTTSTTLNVTVIEVFNAKSTETCSNWFVHNVDYGGLFGESLIEVDNNVITDTFGNIVMSTYSGPNVPASLSINNNGSIKVALNSETERSLYNWLQVTSISLSTEGTGTSYTVNRNISGTSGYQEMLVQPYSSSLDQYGSIVIPRQAWVSGRDFSIALSDNATMDFEITTIGSTSFTFRYLGDYVIGSVVSGIVIYLR